MHAPVPLEKEELRVFSISPSSCSSALLSLFRLSLFAFQPFSVYLFLLSLSLLFSRFFLLLLLHFRDSFLIVSEIRSSSFSPVHVFSFIFLCQNFTVLPYFVRFPSAFCVARYVPPSSLYTLFDCARHIAISVDTCNERCKSLNARWTHRV